MQGIYIIQLVQKASSHVNLFRPKSKNESWYLVVQYLVTKTSLHLAECLRLVDCLSGMKECRTWSGLLKILKTWYLYYPKLNAHKLGIAKTSSLSLILSMFGKIILLHRLWTRSRLSFCLHSVDYLWDFCWQSAPVDHQYSSGLECRFYGSWPTVWVIQSHVRQYHVNHQNFP